MNKLFGLFLLALAFFAPGAAQAAARFAVCTTTCTWNNDGITTGIMWSTTSGGATGASAPTSGDTVTIDAATCVGGTTCTITTFAGTISAQSISWGACTASTTGCIIDASVNNTNFTIVSGGGIPFNGNAGGTKKWLAGTGTYNLTATNANGMIALSATGDQGSVFSGATWNLISSAANTAQAANSFAGFTFGPTTISTGATGQAEVALNSAVTFTTLSLAAPLTLSIASGITATVTGALSVTGGSSSNPVLIFSRATSGTSTLSVGSASAISWASFRNITTSGAGTITATNCIDFKQNVFGGSSGCAAPSGGGGGRIIGG